MTLQLLMLINPGKCPPFTSCSHIYTRLGVEGIYQTRCIEPTTQMGIGCAKVDIRTSEKFFMSQVLYEIIKMQVSIRYSRVQRINYFKYELILN